MSNVPTRIQWRGYYVTSDVPAEVTRFEPFGWVIHRHVMPVGSTLITRAKTEVDRANAPNLTLYVRGRMKLEMEEGGELEDRVPGMFSGDRPNTPAGAVRHTPIEEVEFWCFNWHANRGALPSVQVMRLEDGQALDAPAGQRVLLCHGELGTHTAGDSFTCDGTPLVAQGTCYGFLIGGHRD